MQVSLDDSELSLIPDTDEDRDLLRSFMEIVRATGSHDVDADFDGVNLDELVFSPACHEHDGTR